VVMKRFKLQNKKYKNFYHFDFYRLKNSEIDAALDLKNILKNPKNIVAIEWPGKIKKLLPQKTIKIEFKFINQDSREIIFKNVL